MEQGSSLGANISYIDQDLDVSVTMCSIHESVNL